MYDVAHWRESDNNSVGLILRNTRTTALQDSAEAWPARVGLEGFAYERLGGFGATVKDDANYRSIEQWEGWLAKTRYGEKPFNPDPYVQLAKVLVASGKPDQAFAIQFAGREAERAQAWHDRAWFRWAWFSFLRWVFGYGIGPYTFFVLGWVAGSVLLGLLVLRQSRAARMKGVLWCSLASFSRLLPIIELNKEFTEFFNDPFRDRLSNAQVAFFSFYALWGWLLGLVLAAAMSGLTQHS